MSKSCVAFERETANSRLVDHLSATNGPWKGIFYRRRLAFFPVFSTQVTEFGYWEA
jgi:hypothetical protein